LTSLSIYKLSVVRQGKILLDNISLELPVNGNLLITGLSGSGKTFLLHALAGKVLYQGSIGCRNEKEVTHPKIVLVEQHYYFKNKSNTSSFYYQQRFNSADAEDVETVWQALEKQPDFNSVQAAYLLQNFGMTALKDASLLQLSSGEHKRFQIIKALLNKPEVLLLDEPYMGLDIASRKYLNEVLNDLAKEGCKIIFVSTIKNAPECMSHLLHLENGKTTFFGKKEAYAENDVEPSFVLPNLVDDIIPHFSTAVAMKNVTIKYGKKTILHSINWQVDAGEKWLLKGHNGAGKSTLISLITGDNPQAFANDVVLFDRKKGSGESIWDIKKNIGYISPELQWHFDTATTCRQAVGSGFFDTIGLFRKLNLQQEETIYFWLNQFELKPFANKLLRSLPISKQKLVLLARAMVKNPPMLILDEPCQGLDEQQKEHFLQIIETICTENRTLLYVSHYAAEVPACIENVIELKAGEATIYRLTPTPLLTERDKTQEIIFKTQKQEPAVTTH
jgi:molybdate transport system ATP-binding protein